MARTADSLLDLPARLRGEDRLRATSDFSALSFFSNA